MRSLHPDLTCNYEKAERCRLQQAGRCALLETDEAVVQERRKSTRGKQCDEEDRHACERRAVREQRVHVESDPARDEKEGSRVVANASAIANDNTKPTPVTLSKCPRRRS
jgi:hypothetical protein